MNSKERLEILLNAKIFFKKSIAGNHAAKLKSLSKLSTYKYNPFLVKYLAKFFSGKNDANSIAKVLLYPRILGTSINTSFGSNIQKFISNVLGKYGSTTSGIDIEFIDSKDNRKKYCQIKTGPETINKDDVETITRHFNSIKMLARTNNLDLRTSDLLVGVLYGTEEELSTFYKKLNTSFEVVVGQEFWERLTGDSNFYNDLSNAFEEVAEKISGHQKIIETLKLLSNDIEEDGKLV